MSISPPTAPDGLPQINANYRQCEYAMHSASMPRCLKPVSRKYGDHWFCDEHGSRGELVPAPAPGGEVPPNFKRSGSPFCSCSGQWVCDYCENFTPPQPGESPRTEVFRKEVYFDRDGLEWVCIEDPCVLMEALERELSASAAVAEGLREALEDLRRNAGDIPLHYLKAADKALAAAALATGQGQAI